MAEGPLRAPSVRLAGKPLHRGRTEGNIVAHTCRRKRPGGLLAVRDGRRLKRLDQVCRYLADGSWRSFSEKPRKKSVARSNPHMEACEFRLARRWSLCVQVHLAGLCRRDLLLACWTDSPLSLLKWTSS